MFSHILNAVACHQIVACIPKYVFGLSIWNLGFAAKNYRPSQIKYINFIAISGQKTGLDQNFDNFPHPYGLIIFLSLWIAMNHPRVNKGAHVFLFQSILSVRIQISGEHMEWHNEKTDKKGG